MAVGGGGVLLYQETAAARAGTGAAAQPRASPVPTRSSAPSVPAPSTLPPSSAPALSTPPPAPRVPADGPGTFRRSWAEGEPQGRGPVRRYRVEVEDGVSVDPDEAAREVAAVLGHPRGWTADPRYGFQLVAEGPVDFTVKIATPGTTDRLCGVTRPESRGMVNCRTGHDVVVNLRLWTLGSPRFDGPVGEYRALIVNHEVGHELGRGHETCPGPGRPAPAMMQQIKGLRGCTANAWPYDARGRYVTGPAVP
ncbi:DUF3152 domain-containing protein [Streptomyces zhihengii]|uniref:DUF3152 domain-containing protein n=1 Tax=Streptomyces zhihengii TaxID=1818004 RepID=UPI0036A6EE69